MRSDLDDSFGRWRLRDGIQNLDDHDHLHRWIGKPLFDRELRI